jgi:deoxyadenosine/deoxycytidine kinase
MSSQKLYKNPFTICIEGNIGSGKTTFLNHFQHFDNATVLKEPVESWQNLNGVNMLASLSIIIFLILYHSSIAHHIFFIDDIIFDEKVI